MNNPQKLRCCQCLCVVHSWMSLLFTLVFILSCVLCIWCCQCRVNRRDNQEWTTQRHWQHQIHKTQDKINTRVNRRDNQEWTTQRHWLCIWCCQCLCVIHSWSSLLFTLVFISSCVLCIRCCQCLCVVYSWLSLLFTRVLQSRMNNTEKLTTSDTQDTGQNKH
jgi:Flp pilus assembly protein TadB